MSLLDGLGITKPSIALKGGTVAQPLRLRCRGCRRHRLNYIGAAARETMLDERPKVDACARCAPAMGCRSSGCRPEHADRESARPYSIDGGLSARELDVNFMLRVPLWEPVFTECRPVGSFRAAPARVLEPHELAAGKFVRADEHVGAPTRDRSSTRAARTRGLRSGRHRREPGLAVGNVVGSNIFNIGAILGLVECGVVVIAGAVVRHRGGCRHRAAADRAGRAAHHRTC